MWSNEHKVLVSPHMNEITLQCQCGWHKSFGYSPHPVQLIQGEFDHLRDAVGGLTGNKMVEIVEEGTVTMDKSDDT